jgi:hypothetical protein
MNVNDKLKEAIKEPENIDDIIKNIVDERNQLEINLHLFKIIKMAIQIEKAVKDGYFNDPEVVSITLVFDDMDYVHFQTGFYLTNEYGEKYTEEDNAVYYEKPIEFFSEVFNELGKFKIDFINENCQYKTIQLNENIKEEILKIFLNEELKKIYDYNNMQLELPANNENNPKKLKM